MIKLSKECVYGETKNINNEVYLRLIDALWDSNSCSFKAQTLLVRILMSS